VLFSLGCFVYDLGVGNESGLQLKGGGTSVMEICTLVYLSDGSNSVPDSKNTGADVAP